MIRPMADPDRSSRSLLEGAQVWLRPFEPSDADGLAQWLNDAETARYLPGAGPVSASAAADLVADWIRDHGRSSYRFVICRADDGVAIGYAGLQRIDWVNGSASIDIAIGDGESRGRGNGSDALRVLIGFGFESLRLERIWLLVYSFNTRAIETYRRLGLTLEGTFRRGRYYRGTFHDVNEMAILRDEWSSSGPAAT
jgi:RimJ/RimL family protein N-acetyltransferase